MYDAVLVLGKELRRAPERARRELRARSAAAAIAHRGGARLVLTLEAPLAGQSEVGSAIVFANLTHLGVSPTAILQESCTHSTREEAIRAHALVQSHGLGRLLVVTSRYHVQRARYLFTDHFGAGGVTVHAPTGFLRDATAEERAWIRAGIPSESVMASEGQVEAWLLRAARGLSWLPSALRWGMETQAGLLLRRATVIAAASGR